MERHVEGDDAEAGGDRLVQHQMPVLARVGAARMKAQKRDPGPGLFEIDTMLRATKVEGEIAADDGIKSRCHGALPTLRGRANRSLKKRRLLRKG